MTAASRLDQGDEQKLLQWLQAIPAEANQDRHLVWRGRYVSLDVLVGIGSRSCFLPIEEGVLGQVEILPQKMRISAFSIHASAEAWEKFWQPMPRPGWHDLFAMNKRGHARIEGDLRPFMQNLQYFKDLFAIPRRFQEDA